MTLLAIILIFSGLFFLTVSGLGIIRLPDFYSRTHAVGKSETLGAALTLGGLAVYNGFEISSFKLIVILAFVFLTNPTATHAITREAIRSGLQLWINPNGKELPCNAAKDKERSR